jgi:thymidylate synthase
MLKIRDGKLEWSQIMRSNDLFRGLPYNFVQFMSLQEVVAGWVGVEPGTYTHFSDSLHVYEGDMELEFTCPPEPLEYPTDSLALSRKLADPVWREINRRVDLLVEKNATTDEFLRIAQVDNAPQAFTNLMAVVVADAARRRGNVDATDQAILLCRNPVLQHLWQRWAKRQRHHPSNN